MKFGYNNDNNDSNFRVDHRISQMANSTPDHFNFSKSREAIRYKQLKRLLVNFTLILVELLVIILIAFYFISPLNRISHVSVVGNRTILANNMVNNMKAKPGNSVFRLLAHKNHLKKYAFKQNAQLKSIHMNVSNWNHVQVRIAEYPVIAYLKSKDRYYAVANNSRTAYQCTTPNQADPVLVNFKTSLILKRFIKYYKLIPNSVRPDVDKIEYVPNKIDPNRIHVYMSDGNQIYANYQNWQHKMKYYAAISKSMHHRGTINMELGVYSKSFNR